MANDFPPKWEFARYERLEKYKEIYDGEIQKLVKNDIEHLRIGEKNKKTLYVAVNFASKISRYFSSLILGKDGIYFDSENNQEKINEILKRNEFDKLSFEAVIDQSRFGYFFLRVRKDSKEKAIIDQIQNDQISIEYNQENKIKKATLFTYLLLADQKGKEKKYLYKEIYLYPNNRVEEEEVIIERELWTVNEKREPNEKVELSVYDSGLVDKIETGLSMIPVFRFDNLSDSSHSTGESDFKDLLPLFNELNDKTSSISKQLRKHMESRIAVPAGTLTSGGEIRASEADIFEVGEGEMTPQYIVNMNPQIDQAFKYIENILRNISSIIQIPLEAFGIDQRGGVESPEGFRLRMFETTQIVNSKRLYLYFGLVKVIQAALTMEGVEEDNGIEIVWSDPLPVDSKIQIDVLAMQVGSKLKSRRRAVKELQQLDEEQLEEEMKLIDDEDVINEVNLDQIQIPSSRKAPQVVEEDSE